MSQYVPCECGGVHYRYHGVKRCRACYAMPTDVLLDELELLASETPEQAARRLGMELWAIGKRMYRAGRPEIGRPFVAAAKRQAAARRVAA